MMKMGKLSQSRVPGTQRCLVKAPGVLDSSSVIIIHLFNCQQVFTKYSGQSCEGPREGHALPHRSAYEPPKGRKAI